MRKYGPRLWELFLAWFLVALAVLALALVLAGCFGPYYPPDRYDIEVDESIVKVHDQDRVMLLMEARVATAFDADLPHHDDVDARVFWASTRCPYHLDSYMVVYQDECLYGIMFGCDEMFVALSNRDWGDPPHTCGSALTHEYGHCLLLELGWEDAALPCSAPAADPDDLSWVGDANHSWTEWWLLNANVHGEACDRGW